MKTKPAIITFLTIRKVIGFLGFLLPIVVVLGSQSLKEMLGSVSAYYYTNMREVFVGTLSCLGLFLISYHGYDLQDRISAKICGGSAIGVALFPTLPDSNSLQPIISLISNDKLSNNLHHLFAFLLFITFSYMSLFLFRKTDDNPSKEKNQRNKIYTACGLVILLCLLLALIYKFGPYKSTLKGLHPIFWLEFVMLWAFGTSWLVKGGTILKDKKGQG